MNKKYKWFKKFFLWDPEKEQDDECSFLCYLFGATLLVVTILWFLNP